MSVCEREGIVFTVLYTYTVGGNTTMGMVHLYVHVLYISVFQYKGWCYCTYELGCNHCLQ